MPRLKPVVPLLAALACACAPALARAATVAIAPSGGGPAKTLELGALTSSFDVHGATYTLRAADGTTSSVTVADGISLRALLSAAGLDADPFAYVEVPHPDGASDSYVLADRLGDAGSGVPVVWSDAQGVHFLRPSAGAGDPNLDDDLAFPDGALALNLHTGEPLVPRVSVSTLRPRPHEAVRFSASLAAGTLDAGMRFSWYFDGGAYVYGASVTHRFASPGPYKVQLNVVRGAANVTILPTIVHVRVVAAQRKRSGGAHGSAAAGGDGGATGGVVTGSGSGGTDAGVASAAPTGGSAAHAAPGTSAPAPARPVVRPRSAPPGELVSGTLLDAASAAAVSDPAHPGAQAAGAALARRVAADRPLRVPVGAWVALGLLALLGLGWALESRHTLPFWQP